MATGQPGAAAVGDMEGELNRVADWNELQAEYRERTGYSLVVADANGAIRMGVPDCDRFPCAKSCRECREDIIREALRTGRVCVDACHQGYCLWGLPIQRAGRLVGGVIVIGGEMAIKKERGLFEAACVELYQLMEERGLLPVSEERPPLPEGLCRFVQRQAFEVAERAMEEHGRMMVQAMKTAEFGEARAAYDRMRISLEGIPELPMDVVRGLVTDLIFRARHEFATAGVDAYACFAEAGALAKGLAEAGTIPAIDALMRRFLERFEFLLSQGQKDPDDLLVERATTYLEEHLREDLDRDGVAKAVGISPSHFSRLLRERKGRTFTDLLGQYRIERACGLLVRTSKTLAEIAGEAGFCDQSYFSKVFRRYKGETPARYRAAHRI